MCHFHRWSSLGMLGCRCSETGIALKGIRGNRWSKLSILMSTGVSYHCSLLTWLIAATFKEWYTEEALHKSALHANKRHNRWDCHTSWIFIRNSFQFTSISSFLEILLAEIRGREANSWVYDDIHRWWLKQSNFREPWRFDQSHLRYRPSVF